MLSVALVTWVKPALIVVHYTDMKKALLVKGLERYRPIKLIRLHGRYETATKFEDKKAHRKEVIR